MEFGGFDPGCPPHRMQLLPVTDFSFTYQCRSCPGRARVTWAFHGQEGMAQADIVAADMKAISKLAGQECVFDKVLTLADVTGMAVGSGKDTCPCDHTCPCHDEEGQ